MNLYRIKIYSEEKDITFVYSRMYSNWNKAEEEAYNLADKYDCKLVELEEVDNSIVRQHRKIST